MSKQAVTGIVASALFAVACGSAASTDASDPSPTPPAEQQAAPAAHSAEAEPVGIGLPDGFPDDVLLPTGAVVISGSPAGEGRWELGVWLEVADGVEVVADLARRLEADGWVVEAPEGTELAAGFRLTARRDAQAYRLLVVKDPEGPRAVTSISLAL